LLPQGVRAREALAPRDLAPADAAAVLEESGLRLRQGQRGVSCAVGQLAQRLGAEVVDCVAGLVVARVIGQTRSAAVDGRLLGRLENLGAAEQAAGGDPDRDEGAVVRAAVERGGVGRLALAGEMLVEQRLDLRGAGRSRRRGVGAVAVVDEPDVVGYGSFSPSRGNRFCPGPARAEN
jgi:hypothetical protein